MKEKEKILKILSVAVLLVFALLSFFVFAENATNAQSYAHTIEAIDEKKATVMGFTATAAAVSTAIAAIPGDASTPIANQIMEISEYLFIVVCFLVLEKSLLTIMGFLSFKILIPVGCVLLAAYVFLRKQNALVLGLKFIVFALVLALIIPFSVYISDLIYEANQFTVEEISAEFEDPDASEATVPDETVPEETSAEEQSWGDKIKDAISNAVDSVKDTAEEALDKVEHAVALTGKEAKAILNKFIDAIALFIITYCAIPVIVVFVMIWLVKFMFAVTIQVPDLEKIKALGAGFVKKELPEATEV